MRWPTIPPRLRRVGTLLELVAVTLVCTLGIESDLPDVHEAVAPMLATTAFHAPVMPTVTAAPKPAIKVHVVSNGAPAADAEVSLHDGNKPITAKTDRDGIARFVDVSSGPYELWATREALASPIARVDNVTPESSVELVLAAAATVRGRVTASGPLPSGAAMHFLPLDIDQPVRTVPLDEQGRFAIAGLARGHWRVEAEAVGFVQPEPRVLELDGKVATVDIALERASSVIGTVVDANGAPVAKATIVLRDQTGAPVRNTFSVSAMDTRWVHPLAGIRWLPAHESQLFGAPRPGFRPAECGRGHCGLDLGNTRGTVVHAIANGTIATLFPENRTEAGRVVVIQHTGGVKSFYMHLDEIRPGLEAGMPIRAGDPIGLLGTTGILHSAPHLHFAMTHELFGRTWYVDPLPIIQKAVVLPAARPYEPILAPPPKPELDTTLAVATVTTDAKGAFRVDGVAPGTFVAVAYAPEYPPAGSSPFTVMGGKDATGVIVRLNPGALVDGRVLGPHGSIAGATVTAVTGFGESANKIAMTTTDKNGEFVLRSLAGKITLTVSAPGYGEADRALVIEDRDRSKVRRHEEFRLTIEDSTLRGQLFAPEGGAAAGVMVRVIEGTTRRRSITDSQGRFTLSPVASGHYVLELSSPEYPTKRITLESGRWIETRLDAGGGVRCIVRDAQSRSPLAGVRIEATGPGGQTASRTTDAKGSADLRGLVAGEWKLSARGAGYTIATAVASVRIGRVSQDVQLELSRGAMLTGVVRDSRGQRVSGARVSLGTASAVSDADGNFRLTDVPTGAGTLEADLDGRHGALSVQLAPGDERNSLTIELSD